MTSPRPCDHAGGRATFRVFGQGQHDVEHEGCADHHRDRARDEEHEATATHEVGAGTACRTERGLDPARAAQDETVGGAPHRTQRAEKRRPASTVSNGCMGPRRPERGPW